MKRTILILFFAACGLWGQSSPNCSQALTFTGATAGTAINTISGSAAGCAGWRLTWSVTGFTAATIQLEGSQDNSSWAAFSGATIVLEGSNPTSWTSATTSNTIVVRASLPYVRVNITSVTGSGSIKTLILGYSGTSAQMDNSGSGSPTGAAGGDLSGTYPNPTVVQMRGGKCTVDASGNLICQGSVTSNAGSGVTGAVDLVGKTSGSAVTLTVADSTAPGTMTIPGATGKLNYIVSPGTSGNCVKLAADGIGLVDAGSPCGTGSGGGGALGYSASNALTAATTYFLPPVGGAAASTTESNVQGRATSAAPIANLYVQLSAAPGVGNSLAITLRDGGVSQAVTCTISGAATTCSDVTHTFTPAANDLIDFQLVDTGVTATLGIVVTYSYGASGPAAMTSPVRAQGTVYQNTGTSARWVNIGLHCGGANTAVARSDTANPPTTNVALATTFNGSAFVTFSFVVPAGSFYKLQANDGIVSDCTATLNSWVEWQ